jgi:hypothetical protein
VEERLRRNATAIDAHAARICFGIDERDAEAEIGREKRSGIPTRTGADNGELNGSHV